MLFPMHSRISLAPWPQDTQMLRNSLLFTRTPRALCSCSPAGQPPAWTGVTPPQVEDPELALVEVLTVPSCPPLQPVQALLQGCTAQGRTGHCSCFVSSSGGTNPFIQPLMDELNNTGHRTEPGGADKKEVWMDRVKYLDLRDTGTLEVF